jgi:hypothetical protein
MVAEVEVPAILKVSAPALPWTKLALTFPRLIESWPSVEVTEELPPKTLDDLSVEPLFR